MTTRTSTCTKRHGDHGESCGGDIRPSYIGGVVLGEPRKARSDGVHPAQCQRCAAEYADMVSVSLTQADLALIGDRVSEHTREMLKAAATEGTSERYWIEMTEDAARELASKTANLGLRAIAAKVREELDGLTSQRRQR